MYVFCVVSGYSIKFWYNTSFAKTLNIFKSKTTRLSFYFYFDLEHKFENICFYSKT